MNLESWIRKTLTRLNVNIVVAESYGEDPRIELAEEEKSTQASSKVDKSTTKKAEKCTKEETEACRVLSIRPVKASQKREADEPVPDSPSVKRKALTSAKDDVFPT